MLSLIKPNLDYKTQYIEMIKEWQQFGGPYAPCIVEYDCGNSIDKLDYDAVLMVVDNYSKGNVFEYDIDNFESSDFYFIIEDDNYLVGVCEIRHNLKSKGIKIKGHLSFGIRPTKRNLGYASKIIECAIERIKKDNIEEIFVCVNKENIAIIKTLENMKFTLVEDIYTVKRFAKKI